MQKIPLYLFIVFIFSLSSCQDSSQKEFTPPPPSPTSPSPKTSSSDDIKTLLEDDWTTSGKYQGYAAVSDDEKLQRVSNVWRALAASQMIQAVHYMEDLKLLKTTKGNLQSTIQHLEQTLPRIQGYIKSANAEDLRDRAIGLDRTNQVGQVQYKLLVSTYKDVDNPRAEVIPYWVCSTCGNIVPRRAPEKCPICGSPEEVFIEIQ